MKKFLLKSKAARKRGLSDIFGVLLGLLVMVGLFGATMMIYKQTQNTSTLSIKLQQLMSISSEVEGMYSTADTYGNSGDILTQDVKNISSLPDSQFTGIVIRVGTQEDSFDLTMDGLSEKVCNRLALSDLGTGTYDEGSSDCSSGYLVVNYSKGTIAALLPATVS